MNRKEKLEKLLKDSEELSDLEIEEDFDNPEELIENLERQITETEVIYYSNAIAYLADNDPSLKESMGAAIDFGYSADDLNSELLATILQQNNMMAELAELRAEIEEIFKEEETEEENN